MFKLTVRFICLFILVVACAACATPTPTPTSTPVPPTVTPLPTNTPVPTATSTNTPTFTPTSTPTLTPTPTNTSTPMPTDTPLPPTATPTSIPPSSTPTATLVPPTSTNLPNPCNLQPGQAGLLLNNTHDFKVLLTIGGGEWGTHDFWFEPNSITAIQFPPGRYTATLNISGRNYKFAADAIVFEAESCTRMTTP